MRHFSAFVVLVSAVCGMFAATAAQVGGGRGGTVSVPSAAPGGEAPTAGTAIILGQVVDAASGAPVAGAAATLSGPPSPAGPPTALTNAQGHFVFRDLPKATYTITVQAHGYLAASFGQRRPEGGPSRSIVLADGQRVTDAVIRVWKVGVVTGRVVDEDREPVVSVPVRLARLDGAGRLTQASIATTDDRGVYRAHNLMPGDYVAFVSTTTSTIPVAVLASGGSAAQAVAQLTGDIPMMPISGGLHVGDQQVSANGAGFERAGSTAIAAYPTTFHPGVQSPDAATIVRVSSGAEREGVDLQLRMVRMFNVSGIVEGPDGALANFGIRLVPAFASRFILDSSLDAANAATDAAGRFTFLGVPPGSYELRATRMARMTRSTLPSPGPDGSTTIMRSQAIYADEPTLWARVPVQVENRDVAGMVVTLAAGGRISGRVVFDGLSAPPANAPPMMVGASSVTPGVSPAAQPLDQDLAFRTPGLPAGHYLINVLNPPPGWTAVNARAAEVNALVEPLMVGASDVKDVIVTLTDQVTSIAGSVRGATTGADPDAIVVLFPADYRAWIDAGMPARRLRTMAAGPTGAFAFANLVPGAYVVVAVSDAAAIDTRDPAVIERLAAVGAHVSVEVGQQKTQSLSVVPVR